MDRISAAENLMIEASTATWRLLAYDENGEADEIVKAVANAPLVYSIPFANTRHLPVNGVLPIKYIRNVVLGWSYQDDAWHLGLLLSQNIADVRGSRWCELANWPEPDSNVFQDLAYQAGESLANVLNIPFNFIPPRPDSLQKVAQQHAKPPQLPDLPLNIGTWMLDRAEDGLDLVRTRSWLMAKIRRIAWYIILIIVYAVLSIATIKTDLALPNAGTMLPSPEYLPYLGLGIMVILIFMTLYQIYDLMILPNHIKVERGSIKGLRNNNTKWEKSTTDIQSVYITHIIERKRSKSFIKHGEINLFNYAGKFDHLLEQAEQDNEAAPEAQAETYVAPLQGDTELSPLQGIGLHIAHKLGDLPCIYDQRVK